MLLSNSKSFFSSVPYVGSILLIAWLLTNNNFFAYLSLSSAILILAIAAINLILFVWKFGVKAEVEAEINFMTTLSYFIFILLIIITFLVTLI